METGAEKKQLSAFPLGVFQKLYSPPPATLMSCWFSTRLSLLFHAQKDSLTSDFGVT